MVLKQLALIVPRPRLRRACQIALAAAVLQAMGGCGEHHRRTSLRPVYRAPAAVAAPCTNCGSGSSAVVGQPLPGSSSRSLSSEPTMDGSSGSATESTVPQLEQPTSGTRSTGRSYLSEPAPKATIGDDPEYRGSALAIGQAARSLKWFFIPDRLDLGKSALAPGTGLRNVPEVNQWTSYRIGQHDISTQGGTGTASSLPRRIRWQRALLSQQGRSALEVYRPAS